VVISSDFHPAGLGAIPGGGNFFKKSQIFLITRGFQKFWQKTCNQQLLFYYSLRREKSSIVAPCSESRFSQILIQEDYRIQIQESHRIRYQIRNLI